MPVLTEDDVLRGTGRTFRIKLSTMLQMSANPGMWVRVQDHWPRTSVATRMLMHSIKEICLEQGVTTEQRCNDLGYFMRIVNDDTYR